LVKIIIDITGVLGFISFEYGVWLISRPASFITGGLLFMAYAVALGRNQ